MAAAAPPAPIPAMAAAAAPPAPIPTMAVRRFSLMDEVLARKLASLPELRKVLALANEFRGDFQGLADELRKIAQDGNLDLDVSQLMRKFGFADKSMILAVEKKVFNSPALYNSAQAEAWYCVVCLVAGQVLKHKSVAGLKVLDFTQLDMSDRKMKQYVENVLSKVFDMLVDLDKNNIFL